MAGDFTTGRLCHYPLAGSLVDALGGQAPFTTVGTVTFEQIAGRVGTSVLDGTNYIRQTSILFLAGRTTWSCAWRHYRATINASLGCSLSWGGAANVAFVAYCANSNVNNGFRMFANNTVAYAAADALPAAGQWNDFMMTVDGVDGGDGDGLEAKLYRNGHAVLTYTATSMALNIAATTEIRAGNYYNGGGQPDGGRIADLSFWDRVLTPEDYAAWREGVTKKRRGRRYIVILNKRK